MEDGLKAELTTGFFGLWAKSLIGKKMTDYIPVIPKTELLDGEYYIGQCRNAKLARWNAENQCFYHWREKFGNWFVETIKCPEDEIKYDVFVAKKRVRFDKNTKEIPFNAL